jgi:hypothetical protein
LKRLATALAALITALVILGHPLTAQAVPYVQGNFGALPYENSYPTVAGCSGTFFLPSDMPGGAVKYGNWAGRQVKLEFYYSNRCGAYARISNAPASCQAEIRRDSNGDRREDGRMWETVDPGIDFAYTRIANNLNGRLALAQLVCVDGNTAHLVTSTDWY